MTVSDRGMGELAKDFGKERPIMKLGSLFLQYSGEAVSQQARPMPDVSRVIDYPSMNHIVRKGIADRCEQFCRDNRNTFGKHLKDTFVDEPTIKDLYHELEMVITRFMYNKIVEGEIRASQRG